MCRVTPFYLYTPGTVTLSQVSVPIVKGLKVGDALQGIGGSSGNVIF